MQKLCTYALRVRRRDPLSTNDQTPVPPRRPAVDDQLLAVARTLMVAAAQRLEPVTARAPTHADWHQAVVGPREMCGLERQLYEVLRS